MRWERIREPYNTWGRLPVANVAMNARLVARAQDGDRAALAELCKRNVRLVFARVIPRAAAVGAPLGRDDRFYDFVQWGFMGLLRAVESFDAGRGYAFSTYAKWWIDAYAQRCWNTLTTERRRNGGGRGDLSLDAPVPSTDRDGLTFVDQIEDESADLDAPIEALERTHERQALLASAMRSLTETQRLVLRQRWLGDAPTQPRLRDVGQAIDRSGEYVRLTENAAFEKLIATLGVEGLDAPALKTRLRAANRAERAETRRIEAKVG